MRYTLNEKFILRETFTLNEATSADVINSRLSAVRTAVDEYITAIDAIIPKLSIGNKDIAIIAKNTKIKDAVSEMAKLAKSISNTIKVKGGMDSIKTDLESYANTLNNLFTAAGIDISSDRKYATLNYDVNELNKSITNWDSGDMTKVNKAYEIFKKLHNAFVTEFNTWNKETADEGKVKDIKDKLTAVSKSLKENKDALDAFNTDGIDEMQLEAFADSLSELDDAIVDSTTLSIAKSLASKTSLKITNVAVRDRLLAFPTEAEKINNLLKKLANINIVADRRQKADDTARETAEKSTFDYRWDHTDKTKEADIDAFWDDYYKSWGGSEEKVKGLGQAFREECQKLGFGDENPFVQFLKKYFAKYPAAALARTNYELLHNAYIRHDIGDDELTNADDIQRYNIVMQSSLWNSDAGKFKQYISIYKKLKNAKDDKKVFTGPKAEDIISRFGNNASSKNYMVYALMDGTELRPVDAIERIYNQSFNSDGKTQPFTDDDISNLAQKIKNNPGINNNRAKLASITQYLISNYLATDDRADDRNKLYSKYSSALSENTPIMSLKELLGLKLPNTLAKYAINSAKIIKLIDALLFEEAKA